MTENCVFNEKVHAFLIGLFYQELKAAEGPAGEECFIKAVQRTAEQRGHRMALRAMRDQRPLDYNTYMAYGEIYATIPGKMEMAGEYPDAETRVYTCAWHDTFKEMGLEACGLVYCREIDKGIVRGFNPDLLFEQKSVLHNAPCCRLVFRNAALDNSVPVSKEAKKDWDYHCGHYYKTFGEYIRTVFLDGENIIKRVDEKVADRYGADCLDTLHRYLETDFNLIKETCSRQSTENETIGNADL